MQLSQQFEAEGQAELVRLAQQIETGKATSEQFDLAKALGEVKDLVEQAIAKSVESSSNGISEGEVKV